METAEGPHQRVIHWVPVEAITDLHFDLLNMNPIAITKANFGQKYQKLRKKRKTKATGLLS